MKVAIVGSRSIRINILNLINYLSNNITCYEKSFPDNGEITELVSGGCLNSPDQDVKEFCERKDYKCSYKEFLPDEIKYPQYKYGYQKYYFRNMEIVNYSDFIVICYDGKSKGSSMVINLCKAQNRSFVVLNLKDIEKYNLIKERYSDYVRK